MVWCVVPVDVVLRLKEGGILPVVGIGGAAKLNAVAKKGAGVTGVAAKGFP